MTSLKSNLKNNHCIQINRSSLFQRQSKVETFKQFHFPKKFVSVKAFQTRLRRLLVFKACALISKHLLNDLHLTWNDLAMFSNGLERTFKKMEYNNTTEHNKKTDS